ncbi:uncharacterized protein LOC131327621 [Rhododendron vialii]|uniref:uncharacterized protein LOC131327621 n=1 Tax=Rhododendron vialii TaxID=182163 RepID=UPI00265D6F58|nr:uncharacterized protein LOC131327621 [Rhododendron vialii]
MPTSSRTRGASSRPPTVCYKCIQPGHICTQCLQLLKACYNCGKIDHLAWSCPQGAGARSESGLVQQPGVGRSVGQQSFRGTQRQQQPHFCQTSSVQSSGSTRERVRPHLLKVPIRDEVSCRAPKASVVRDTFLLFNSLARVLFDSGALHSFITGSFVCALELDTENLDSPLIVETPLGGKSSLSHFYKDC